MRHASTITASFFGYILLLWSLQAAAQPRVILASFDGLGQQILEDDPAGKELVNLRVLLRRGRVSRGVQPAFPSTTANSHAAIWTGAYGDRSGVSGNWNPVLPRAEHTFLERRVGFRSESLTAEPLWVSAARQGVSVVAHQVTQVYPFTAASAGLNLPHPPVVLNSYQTRKAADYRVLRAADVQPLPDLAWNPPLPASALPARHFTWEAGPVRYVASLVAGQGSRVYDAMVIAERPDGPRIQVPLVPTEQEWALGRMLARHFSAPLPIAQTREIAGFGPLAAVFRLWETNADGEFLLLSMPLQELGFAHGAGSQATVAADLVRDAGPLVGNGPSTPYLSGRLGASVYQGGNGLAELRYLECMEFIARQYNRYTEWLWTRYQPRFLLDYFPFPDEMDHGWLGLSRETGAAAEARALRYQEFRRRGYQIIDQRIGLLRQLAERDNAILAITSDHGMAPVVKNVNINAALREVGYLVLDDNEQIDAKRTRATGDYAILLNTTDWKGGIVPLSQKQEVLRDLAARLGQIKDPETGTPVFARFYTEAEHGKQFGIGGPAGFDLYFDLAPGYAPERKHVGPAVEPLDVPRGRHGFRPSRADMRAIFVAWGKGIGHGSYGRMRSTQIAPTVSRWLMVKPPIAAKDRPASK